MDKEAVDVDHEGHLFTNAPYDIMKVFSESFQVVVSKKIKHLALRVLRVFQQIISQYQKGL